MLLRALGKSKGQVHRLSVNAREDTLLANLGTEEAAAFG